MKMVKFTNSVEPDEVAHHEPPHLNLHICPPVFEFSILYNLENFFFLQTCRCAKLLLENDLNYCISSVIRQSLFSFQNNHKNLDPSYKMDLDLWDCFGRKNLNYSKILQLWLFSNMKSLGKPCLIVE